MSKHEESKFDKLKQFLGIRGTRGNQGATNVGNLKPTSRDFIFTNDRLKDISVHTSPQQRLKNIKDLSEIVSCKYLEQNAVESIWHNVKDLLKPTATTEERHTVLRFLQCLVKGQYEQLGVMRAHFFRVIKGHTLFEDLSPRLDLLKALSSDGKDLEYLEEDIGPFLLDWMKAIMSSSRIHDFLQLIVNTIKFNAAYLDEEVVAGLVMLTCSIATTTSKEDDIELCLKVLDTVICYNHLPLVSLDHFIVCLCQVLSLEKFTQDTWQLMRKLLGTHLGHSAIHSMCNILQDSSSTLTGSGALLHRGAVFFVSMALWGSKRVTSLKYPPSAVLPSFLQSLSQCKAPVLANEMILSVQRLLKKNGDELPTVTWDLALDLIQNVFKLIEANPTVSPVMISNLHDLLTSIETLHERGEFHGSTQRFFSIIETCANKRPENSIMMLVSHKVQDIFPSVKDNWILKLDHLLEKYFKQEVRTKIRLKILESLSQIIDRNKYLYEDTLVELVVLPHLSRIDLETDTEVKVKAVGLLISLIDGGQSVWAMELISILHKVICKLWQAPAPPSPTLSGSEQRLHERPCPHSMDTEDIMPAIDGLIQLFKNKLHNVRASPIVRIYELLYEHLQAHYAHPHVMQHQHTGTVRKRIFELFLELRADSSRRLGLLDGEKAGLVVYSSYVYCKQNSILDEEETEPTQENHETDVSAVTLSYAEVFKCIRICLEKEYDWNVLKLVLEKLPLVLQNKTLLLAAHPADVHVFCGRLCLMVSDRNIGLPEKLQHVKLSKSDFHSYIFPVLTCLVSYRSLLDKHKQHDLVRCLEFGLVSKCARICVRALTVCALEMQDIMMRQLPAVLLKLSQISATVAMAIPLMEFLSSLILLPQLYSNFVEDQYMSIFAIALPYTNPFKYGHYTVSLAYHVVSLWFIKCRLPFRKGFVSFIIKNLKSNVLRQLKELDNHRVVLSQNQESSERIRTQSLNDEALRSRSRAAAANARAKAAQVSPPVLDEAMCTFHKELMETCVDMLARYTFSTRANLPKRSPVAEFLLHEGQKHSWMLGNRVITVTTSGGTKVGRAGLCEKCLLYARAASKPEIPPSIAPLAENTSSRRRHKSAAVRTHTESIALKPLSQDDILVNHQKPPMLEEIREQRSGSFDLGGPQGSASEGDVGHSRREQALLGTTTERIQAVDSVLMGLHANPSDKSIFSPQLCSCWCTQWAEIHIRRPTCTLSWMMRIQNEEDLMDTFPDFPLADISSLFMSEKEEEIPLLKLDNRIDSSKIEDLEYESLLEQHFHGNADSRENNEDLEYDENNLRKTCSSPEFNQSSADMTEVGQNLAKKSLQESAAKQLPGGATPKHTSRYGNLEDDAFSPDHKSTEAKPHKSPTQRTAPDSPKRELGRAKSASSTSFNSIPEEGGSTEQGTAHARGGLGRSPADSPASALGSSRSSLAGSIFGKDGSTQGGINPSFVFLQLYHNSFFGDTGQRPLRLPPVEAVNRSVKMLDMIYPFQTHKIGVVYVGKEQAGNETAILSNQYGSTRYMQFLQGLGQIVRLKDCNPEMTYLGGLDNKGADGQFTYIWQDEVIQIVFHAATLMPNKESDPNCNHKKLHIGNDYVSIVYNDSIEDYVMGTIKCQFNYVNIIIQPLDHASNAVTVQTRDDIEDIIGHTDTKIISDSHLSTLVRQMAVHADLASIILQKQKSNPKDPFASNWLERLRQIKRIRVKIQQESANSPGGTTAHKTDKSGTSGMMGGLPVNMADDFTDFVH